MKISKLKAIENYLNQRTIVNINQELMDENRSTTDNGAHIFHVLHNVFRRTYRFGLLKLILHQISEFTPMNENKDVNTSNFFLSK